MAEKGRPSPLDKHWESERQWSPDIKRVAKGAQGELSAGEIGIGVEISPVSPGGPHHSPFSEPWLLSLWQEQSLGVVVEEPDVIPRTANTKNQIWGWGV